VNAGDNITAYANYSAFAGSYTIGQSPYLDVGSLVYNTTYYFNVEVQNTCGTAHGTVLSFATSSSVGSPSNVTAIPGATSIILSWVKGIGAPNTFIRYKENDCPTDNTTGTLTYLGTASTYTHTGLTSGTDYCYFLIGYDAAVGYSTGYVIIHATTLAAGILPGAASAAIAKPAGTTQNPDISPTLEGNIPLMPYARAGSTSTGIPMGSFAYILLLIVLTGLSYGVWRWIRSVEAVVSIWLFASWISYLLLGRPLALLAAAVFVTLVGIGYGAYRIRSLA
jgi:hypothetical protein